jgi:hypothetical protein
MEVSGQLHAPTALPPPGTEPSVPVEQGAGWVQKPVWRLWRREKSCAVGNRNWHMQPTASSVATPTELSRLSVYTYCMYVSNSCVKIQLKRNDWSWSALNRPELQLYQNNQIAIRSINRRGHHSVGSWQSSDVQFRQK